MIHAPLESCANSISPPARVSLTVSGKVHVREGHRVQRARARVELKDALDLRAADGGLRPELQRDAPRGRRRRVTHAEAVRAHEVRREEHGEVRGDVAQPRVGRRDVAARLERVRRERRPGPGSPRAARARRPTRAGAAAAACVELAAVQHHVEAVVEVSDGDVRGEDRGARLVPEDRRREAAGHRLAAFGAFRRGDRREVHWIWSSARRTVVSARSARECRSSR